MTPHDHVCRCGQAILSCSRDDCAVPNDWQCPSCDAVERDEYFQALELNQLTLQPSTPELTKD